jgi:hypothetical protein
MNIKSRGNKRGNKKERNRKAAEYQRLLTHIRGAGGNFNILVNQLK